jgi:1-acyl-sn-glycerol-3-phosphate acyltransferase
LNLFYGRIEVTGAEHLDPSAPTILACNHPNSIVDPLLLGTITDRQIAFCARDGLFRVPVFGTLLRAVGAIPIRRRSDHGGATADNAAAFSACEEVLAKGGVMAIFPEGKTHGHLRIEPVKTGTARIAISAEASRPGLGVRVVPVGVTYLVRHAFRSDIHLALGPPIVVADAIGGASADDSEAVRALTARIGDALRDLAVHIEKTEDERLIAQVTSIVVGIRASEGLDAGGQSPAERTALVRRVVDAYRWLSEVDPERTRELRERLDRYMEEREDLGLGGERPALQHRGERRLALQGAARVAFLTLGAPLAAFGLATSLVPYTLLRFAMRPLRLSTDRVALFKLLGGAVLFGGAYAAEIALITRSFGALPAALFGASLVPAALFARRFVIETRGHRLQLRSLGAFRARGRLEALRAERASLAKELSELRVSYLEHLGQREEGSLA